MASVTVTNLTRDVLATMLIGRLKIAAAGLFGVGAVIVAFVAAGGAVASSRQAAPATVRTDPGKAADPADAGVGPWIKGVVVDTSGTARRRCTSSRMRSDSAPVRDDQAGRDFRHRGGRLEPAQSVALWRRPTIGRTPGDFPVPRPENRHQGPADARPDRAQAAAYSDGLSR